jgi:hypothetical protein
LQNSASIKIVTPKIAAHSELWHLMELRVQNSYAPIRQIDCVCGYDEVAMLSNASKSNGVFEIAYLTGVEEWRN